MIQRIYYCHLRLKFDMIELFLAINLPMDISKFCNFSGVCHQRFCLRVCVVAGNVKVKERQSEVLFLCGVVLIGDIVHILTLNLLIELAKLKEKQQNQQRCRNLDFPNMGGSIMV